ncbi:uncharacterized protein BX663DRAFT_444665, partial [Cokeromyces recurvatus]|uniref:uncharacterized protein n=1 Tax=Cokeromyces recurvatus TaxID=90255 RepID=UPI00221E4068
ISNLTSNGNNEVLFGNLLRSDRFSVDCLFFLQKEKRILSDHLKLTDFDYEEVVSTYNSIYLDPGRKAVYTAVCGLVKDVHPIIRFSTKEYYHYTGSTKFLVDQQKLKKKPNGIEEVESKIPTHKTAKAEKYYEYLQFMLEHIDILFDFYKDTSGKGRFALCQGRQRAPEIVTNILLNGGLKYNRERRRRSRKKKKKSKKKEKRRQEKKKEGKEQKEEGKQE